MSEKSNPFAEFIDDLDLGWMDDSSRPQLIEQQHGISLYDIPVSGNHFIATINTDWQQPSVAIEMESRASSLNPDDMFKTVVRTIDSIFPGETQAPVVTVRSGQIEKDLDLGSAWHMKIYDELLKNDSSLESLTYRLRRLGTPNKNMHIPQASHPLFEYSFRESDGGILERISLPHLTAEYVSLNAAKNLIKRHRGSSGYDIEEDARMLQKSVRSLCKENPAKTLL